MDAPMCTRAPPGSAAFSSGGAAQSTPEPSIAGRPAAARPGRAVHPRWVPLDLFVAPFSDPPVRHRVALLAIDVTHTTHRRDLQKAEEYARADVPEYWMVDLVKREFMVRPVDGVYIEVAHHQDGMLDVPGKGLRSTSAPCCPRRAETSAAQPRQHRRRGSSTPRTPRSGCREVVGEDLEMAPAPRRRGGLSPHSAGVDGRAHLTFGNPPRPAKLIEA